MSPSSQSMPQATRERSIWPTLRLPRGLSWTALALIGIVVLAAVLRFGNIDAIGQANTYYTAAVESMLQSWHNFFFVAAEPGGSVAVDKPPVGLWLQAISAYFLGVSGFAVVLPQILAGIASVIVLFHLVRRWFGNVAGLIAALALAVTPVAIAVERNNTPDATLILTLLLVAWAFIKATETSKLRFLLLGATLIGIGFNIKMMQALLPLPAMYALYFFGAQPTWWRKLIQLGITTLVLIPLALSWAVIVDLTPAAQRPYVGGSSNNSALDLIVGYNGLQRLLGNGMGGGMPRADDTTNTNSQSQADPPAASAQEAGAQFPTGGPAPNGTPGGPGGAGGMFGTGNPGVLRLFQSGLAAQVSWLLPFGLIMLAAMAFSISWWRPQGTFQRGLLLWGGWLLTCAVFFSVAGFFHQYYLAMLGPPLAAVVAMGTVFLWRLRTTHPIRAALLLLVAAGVTLAFQVYAVTLYEALNWWIAVPVALALPGLSVLLLSLRRDGHTLPRLAFTLVIAALLVVPAVWSGLTTAYADTSGAMTQAYAGNSGRPGIARDGLNRDGEMPDGAPTDGTQPAGGFGGGVNQNLLAYLQANTQDTTYLLVVPSSQAGAQYVLATGRPVLYAGGFNGSDAVIDTDELAQLVAAGEVRYVLWGGGGGSGGNASITEYLQSACTVVTDASLGTATSAITIQRADGPPGGMGGPGGVPILYQCGT